LGEIDETRRGILVIGVTGNPTTLDPLESWWSSGSGWLIAQIVFL